MLNESNKYRMVVKIRKNSERETIKRICEDGFGIDVTEFYHRTDECDYVLTMKERECIDIFRQVPKKDTDKALSYMKWLADCGRN